MNDEYTRPDLVRLIDPNADEARAKALGRRIWYWTTSGILETIGDKTVGSGRERRYSADRLPWCRLFNAMADSGLGLMEMLNAKRWVQLELLKPAEKARTERAMQGKGKPLFLFAEAPPADFAESGQSEWKGSALIAHSPIELGKNWRGGWFVNLTSAFAKPDGEKK